MTREVRVHATTFPQSPYCGPSIRTSQELKLDGNEGGRPPGGVLAELAASDANLLRDYPEVGALEAAIAERIGVASDQVLVTAGADDAIDRVFRACLSPGRRLVLPVPTFEMMYRFAGVAGAEIEPIKWGATFPTQEIVDSIDGDVGLVVLVSPNNPTGRVVSAEDLERVASAMGTGLVLLDHVYVEYADEDLTTMAARLENTVTIRTFSKAWGMAGCRVGYSVAQPGVTRLLRNIGNPFPVSALSLAAVEAHTRTGLSLVRRHVSWIREARSRLTDLLDTLGAQPSPSQGNFVFARFGDRAPFVYDALLSLGIRSRRFPHRPEIAQGIRFSVPESPTDEARLASALALILSPEAVLFDMDGVLADVGHSYRACVIVTAAEFGVDISQDEVWAAVRRGNANNDWGLVHGLLRARGVEAKLAAITETFQRIYLGGGTVPGLRDRETLIPPLQWLKQMRTCLPLAIVTGRPRLEAEWFLDRFGLHDLFDAVVCLEDGPSKPDPGPVRLAMQKLGVARAWMVGDTPDDAQAARAAGCLPIGICAPHDPPDRAEAALRECGAATVLTSLELLDRLLP